MHPLNRPVDNDDFEKWLQAQSARTLADRFDHLVRHDRIGLRILLDEYPEYVNSMVDQYIAHTEHSESDEELRRRIEADLQTLRNVLDTNSPSYRMRLRGRRVMRAVGITRDPSRPPLDVPMYLPRTDR